MGTAAGERRRRVNLADTENCVEGYFHFGARAEGFLALARRENKKKRFGASRFQGDETYRRTL